VAGAVVLVFSLTSAGGVRRSEAGFVAILAQTKTYLNILIDEWEKYSRILEDHLDKVTGIMQPFNEIHAGVRELTNLNGLRGVYRMMDSYRASVSDPACFNPLTYNSNFDCRLQRDFTPPELRRVRYRASAAIADGAYTLENLEDRVFGSGRETIQEVLVGTVPGAADTRARIERNIERNRWQLRRIRSIGSRSRYAARQFQRWGGAERRMSGPPGTECSALDVSDPLGPDGVAGTHDDPTILDQAMNADCKGAAGSVNDPLDEQAHLSEIEAKTLQVAGVMGVVEMAALRAEEEAAREAEALRAAERVEEQRRRENQRVQRGLDCFAAGQSLACTPVVSDADSVRRALAQLRPAGLFW
jgi:hypothetical protein